MQLKRWLLAAGALLVAPLANASVPLTIDSSVPDILNTLGAATKYQNYRGQFTYEHDGKIDTINVVHAVVDGVEYERITYLNGPERKFLREGQPVDCMTAGNHLLRGGRLTLSNGRIISIAQSYRFVLRGLERVAGRQALLLQLIPNDNYRYGLLLGVDTESGLLTKAVISEVGKKVHERIQFVSLEIDPDLGLEAIYPQLSAQGEVTPPLVETAMAAEDEALPADQNSRNGAPGQADENVSQTSPDDEAPAVVESDVIGETTSGNNCRSTGQSNSPWQPAWIPEGFVLTDYSHSPEEGHMATYTDGLAVFSVFVNENAERSAQALVRKGATVSLLTTMVADDGLVSATVVGEIPVITAHRITRSLQPVGAAE